MAVVANETSGQAARISSVRWPPSGLVAAPRCSREAAPRSAPPALGVQIEEHEPLAPRQSGAEEAGGLEVDQAGADQADALGRLPASSARAAERRARGGAAGADDARLSRITSGRPVSHS